MSSMDWLYLFLAEAGGTALGFYIFLKFDEWTNK